MGDMDVLNLNIKGNKKGKREANQEEWNGLRQGHCYELLKAM